MYDVCRALEPTDEPRRKMRSGGEMNDYKPFFQINAARKG
jgi:hypothetical protein